MMPELCRRRFLEILSTTGAGVVFAQLGCGPMGGGTSGTITSSNGMGQLPFAQFPMLQNVGGGVVVSAPNGPLVVVRTGTNAATALSAICTHAGCTVEYAGGQAPLLCPCHGSEFNINGNPVAGPARGRLAVYPASVDAAGITITLG